MHAALNSVLTFLALVVACLSTDPAWPSLSSQLLLAVPISISIPGQPKPARRLLLINRSDSLDGVARRACLQFAKSRVEACASGIISELRPRLEHAILQRTKPPHRAVQLSVSQSDGTSKTLSVALREGDNLESLAYTCLAAHELPVSQHQDLAKALRAELEPPPPPPKGLLAAAPLTLEPKEAELRSKLLQLSSSSTNQIGLAEAHNALAELYYGLSKQQPIGQDAEPTLLEAAHEGFQSAQQLLPQHPIYNNNLGVALCEKKRFADALPMFEKAGRLLPTFASSFSNAGETWMNVAREYGASITEVPYAAHKVVGCYQRALELNFSNAILLINLGEALESLHKYDQATAVYQLGVHQGIWRRATQRPYPSLDRTLFAAPLYPCDHFDFCKLLEQSVAVIQAEWRALLASSAGHNALSANPVESIVSSGSWTEFNINKKGRRNATSCEHMPRTCDLVEQATQATSLLNDPNNPNGPRPISGEIEFLVMSPGTHLKRHCGTSNQRLTLHLAIDAPADGNSKLRVADQYYSWKTGKAVIFDDSFEHEAWNNSTSTRTVLYMSFWHPQLWSQLVPNTLGPV